MVGESMSYNSSVGRITHHAFTAMGGRKRATHFLRLEGPEGSIQLLASEESVSEGSA